MVIEAVVAWLLLAVAVWLGTRSAGRDYGLVFSMLCAAMWGLFALALFGLDLAAGQISLLLAAGLFLILIGSWSTSTLASADQAVTQRQHSRYRAGDSSSIALQAARLAKLSVVPDQFAEWLEQFRDHHDPWPAFEKFIQTTLHDACGAEDVKAYRVFDSSEQLIPLCNADPERMRDCTRDARGVLGWVVKTRRTFFSFQQIDDQDLRLRLARTRLPVRWCFPILRGSNVVGVVTVRSWDIGGSRDLNFLKLLAGMVNDHWSCVAEICRTRAATAVDQASGLMTRSQFLRRAPLVLQRSYDQSKEVAAAAFSVEGLRQLDDQGLWGLRDLAIASVGKALRGRMTPEDCASHFDDSRFVVVWHETDEDQARADVAEIVADLERAFSDQAKWRRQIKVRCGLASSESRQKSLHTLVSEALNENADPRQAEPEPEPTTA